MASQPLSFYTVLIFEPWDYIAWSKIKVFRNTAHKIVVSSPCFLPTPGRGKGLERLGGLQPFGAAPISLSGASPQGCSLGPSLGHQATLHWPRHIETTQVRAECSSPPQRPLKLSVRSKDPGVSPAVSAWHSAQHIVGS